MIQEFQHCLESRLIEVMNMEIFPIQFVPNVNLIQPKLMKDDPYSATRRKSKFQSNCESIRVLNNSQGLTKYKQCSHILRGHTICEYEIRLCPDILRSNIQLNPPLKTNSDSQPDHQHGGTYNNPLNVALIPLLGSCTDFAEENSRNRGSVCRPLGFLSQAAVAFPLLSLSHAPEWIYHLKSFLTLLTYCS
jgi:hypothetical protein